MITAIIFISVVLFQALTMFSRNTPLFYFLQSGKGNKNRVIWNSHWVEVLWEPNGRRQAVSVWRGKLWYRCCIPSASYYIKIWPILLEIVSSEENVILIVCNCICCDFLCAWQTALHSLFKVATTFERRTGFGPCWHGCPSWPPGGRVWRTFLRTIGWNMEETTSLGEIWSHVLFHIIIHQTTPSAQQHVHEEIVS